ncbi:hypothetical protein [Litorisediminicola beolgyonensis]|uniref:Transposase n=1 Tax=Litorisediminicola beolgyonensis TaxID=1173614 RepID=A0ABW3ZF68_9RHOB
MIDLGLRHVAEQLGRCLDAAEDWRHGHPRPRRTMPRIRAAR